MSFIQNTSCNSFTSIFVIVLITCFASIDCLGQQQFGGNNDHHQIVDQQAQQNSFNPTMTRNNQPAIDLVDNSEQLKQVSAGANIGRLIRSARAGEEVVASSGTFMEPKRRRSKRLQMAKDDSSPEEIQILGQQREEKAKQALRKRWHKLADDIIDDVFANQQQQQQQQRYQPNDGNSMKSLDSSYKKKKWFTKQQQQREDDSDNGFEKITILMKKPPSESADSDLMNADNVNSNNLLLTSQPQQPMLVGGGANEAIGIQKPSQYSQSGDSNLQSLNSIRRPNVNMQEHARRILDDKFGIMKESIFTTNNHLGLKGVPKFGSDEEY